MKIRKVLLTAVALMIATVAFTQSTNRGDICQNIPDLTIEQKSKIDGLSSTHQKTMDELRLEFRSEADATKAASIKTKMNTERENHSNNISKLLTPEQKTWFEQNYKQNRGKGYGRGQGCGRGNRQGYGRGFGRGR